jgi:uncharacterized membrane protein YccC
MMAFGVIAGLVLGAFLAMVFVWFSLRRRKLPRNVADRLAKEWQRISGIGDLHRRVIEAENLLDSALRELRYAGSFADKLRRAGPRFQHTETIWKAHKLRNRLAHEMGIHLRAAEADAALRTFRSAFEELC